MTDVPHDLVARRIEYVVQRHRQLDHAETGAQVSARHRYRIDRLQTQLVGDPAQFFGRQTTQVGGIVDRVKQRCGDHGYANPPKRSARAPDAGVIQLVRSAYDKLERGSQYGVVRLKMLQMRERAVLQLLQTPARALDAEQSHERRLAGGSVTLQILAHDLRIARHVQQVVLDLEREPEIGRVAEQGPASRLRRAAENGARLRRQSRSALRS